MKAVTIYHNPRCSKSRQSLELLVQAGIQPEIILYLEHPPTMKKLKELIALLNISPRELLRTSEQAYRDKKLADTGLTDNELLNAMLDEPRLIQRPIVISNGQAVLGRPPENVLTLLR